MVEVDRPNRQRRRKRGKSDTQDAITAARAAQSGDALGAAKTRDGNVEAMRVLRVARSSRARRPHPGAEPDARAGLDRTGGDARRLRDLNDRRARATPAPGSGPAPTTDVTAATKLALRTLARRAIELEAEIDADRRAPGAAGRRDRPELVAAHGVGTDTAGACSSPPATTPTGSATKPPSPTSAASPRSTPAAARRHRHRLNRGGDRQANTALWHIVMTRMACDPAPATTSTAAPPKD